MIRPSDPLFQIETVYIMSHLLLKPPTSSLGFPYQRWMEITRPPLKQASLLTAPMRNLMTIVSVTTNRGDMNKRRSPYFPTQPRSDLRSEGAFTRVHLTSASPVLWDKGTKAEFEAWKILEASAASDPCQNQPYG
jgi:hypothetical protein